LFQKPQFEISIVQLLYSRNFSLYLELYYFSEKQARHRIVSMSAIYKEAKQNEDFPDFILNYYTVNSVFPHCGVMQSDVQNLASGNYFHSHSY
jgi:hypothetical protein